MDITGVMPKMTENTVEVVDRIVKQNFFNPHSGYDVNHDDALQYLSNWPRVPEGVDRVEHFKDWLDGKVDEFATKPTDEL